MESYQKLVINYWLRYTVEQCRSIWKCTGKSSLAIIDFNNCDLNDSVEPPLGEVEFATIGYKYTTIYRRRGYVIFQYISSYIGAFKLHKYSLETTPTLRNRESGKLRISGWCFTRHEFLGVLGRCVLHNDVTILYSIQINTPCGFSHQDRMITRCCNTYTPSTSVVQADSATPVSYGKFSRLSLSESLVRD